MMLLLATVEQAGSKVGQTASRAASSAPELFHLPTHWPAQGDLLQWCQDMNPGTAALLILAGIIYLTCGFYIFKVLVTLNAAIVGGYIGMLIGARSDSEIIGGLVGGFTAAAIAWPLMKYAVAFMGGTFGALLGASLWRVFDLNADFTWAGAAIGMITFGLLSFVLFRGSVMMYTSLQGAAMLVFGLLGLIFKYQSIAPKLADSMALKPLL
ncbi:MAG: hypothetical protein ACREIT_10795, partial [Tepidisphaeraceae bacterium]